MNAQRLFKIVLMDLSSETLKLEDKLEETINSDLDVTTKSLTIKSLLASIVANEASISKFTELISKTENNNNESKPQENGNK
jgi:hypothetical protein